MTDGAREIVPENEVTEASITEQSTITVELEGDSNQYFADGSNECSMDTVYYKMPQAITGDDEQQLTLDESIADSAKLDKNEQPVSNDDEQVPDKEEVPNDKEQVPIDDKQVPNEDQVPNDEEEVPVDDKQVPDEEQVPIDDKQVPDEDEVPNDKEQQLKPDESVADTTDNVTGKKSPVADDKNAKPEKPVTVKGSDSNLPPKKRKQQGIICTVHGDDGISGEGVGSGEKKVTIVVHSDVKKILSIVIEKFHEYSKSVKNFDFKITTTPLVSLEKKAGDYVVGEITNKKKKVEVLPSLSRDDKKKLKIYVDKDLQLEKHLIEKFRDQTDETLGKELCEYENNFKLHNPLFQMADNLW